MKQKRIGIDCRLIDETGVGVYIQNLLTFLPYNTPDIDWFFFSSSKGAEKISKIVPKDGGTIHITSVRWHSVSEQTLFLKIVLDCNLDLMHFTYFSFPILYPRPFVITIHDLTTLSFKTGQATTLNPLLYELKHVGYKLVLKTAMVRASSIITPSNAVKNEIIDRFGTSLKDKITITHEGVDKNLLNSPSDDSLKKKYSTPFLVRLGNFYPHKNIEKLISAFSPIHTDVKLILAGPNDFFASRMQELADAVLNKDSILFHFNPTAQQRVFFYKNALALIQPSLTEGFGLPIIEAQYFKCPVISSKIPVFEELLGDSYSYYFNPHDTDSMQKTITTFLGSHKKSIISDSVDENLVKKFSFKRMAGETFAVYSSILYEN